jgi:hypothetical protein
LRIFDLIKASQVGPLSPSWAQLPFSEPIAQLESCLSGTLLLTEHALYKMDGTGLIAELSLNTDINPGMFPFFLCFLFIIFALLLDVRVQCANDFIEGQLLLVTNSSLYTCSLAEIWSNTSVTCKVFASAFFGSVSSIQTAFGVLWIGSSNGIFFYLGFILV